MAFGCKLMFYYCTELLSPFVKCTILKQYMWHIQVESGPHMKQFKFISVLCCKVHHFGNVM